MSKLSFNKHGLYVDFSDNGQYDSPDESVNQHRFKLVDGVVVDGWPDVTDENIMDEFNTEMESTSLIDFKDDQKKQIKSAAAQKIQALAWKIERATEQDAINGTTTILDVYADREAIRVASNAAEVAIDAESDQESIYEIVRQFRRS